MKLPIDHMIDDVQREAHKLRRHAPLCQTAIITEIAKLLLLGDGPAPRRLILRHAPGLAIQAAHVLSATHPVSQSSPGNDFRITAVEEPRWYSDFWRVEVAD